MMILDMRAEIIDGELVESKILTCSSCGKPNRLRKQRQLGHFRCGACGAVLPNPFSLHRHVAQKVSATVDRLMKGTHGVWIASALVVLLGIAGFISIWTGRPGSKTPLPQAVSRALDIQPPKGGGAVVFTRTPVAKAAPDAPVLPEVTGKIATAPIPAPESPPRRLENGSVIERGSENGNGKLTIDNGTTRDAVIKLVDEQAGRAVVAFYVCSGESSVVGNIPDGHLRLIFASGTDWDSRTGEFLRDKSFAKFDDFLDFTTSTQRHGDELETDYSVFTLTLQPVLLGNATTSEVDEQEFSRY